MLTPAFHFKILEQFVDIFNEQSNILIGILEEEHSDTKYFDVAPYIARCTLEVICGL
jgi:cytochrome P450